jgi:hypothetical protein
MSVVRRDTSSGQSRSAPFADARRRHWFRDPRSRDARAAVSSSNEGRARSRRARSARSTARRREWQDQCQVLRSSDCALLLRQKHHLDAFRPHTDNQAILDWFDNALAKIRGRRLPFDCRPPPPYPPTVFMPSLDLVLVAQLGIDRSTWHPSLSLASIAQRSGVITRSALGRYQRSAFSEYATRNARPTMLARGTKPM